MIFGTGDLGTASERWSVDQGRSSGLEKANQPTVIPTSNNADGPSSPNRFVRQKSGNAECATGGEQQKNQLAPKSRRGVFHSVALGCLHVSNLHLRLLVRSQFLKSIDQSHTLV